MLMHKIRWIVILEMVAFFILFLLGIYLILHSGQNFLPYTEVELTNTTILG